jgi:hypothetical protein
MLVTKALKLIQEFHISDTLLPINVYENLYSVTILYVLIHHI